MRPSLSLACGLGLAAALVTAAPLASAAPKRGKSKPKQPAPTAAASDTPSPPDATDKPSTKSEDATPAKLEEKAPPAPEPPAPSATKPSSEASVSLASDANEAKHAKETPPEAEQGSNQVDQQALGRREAARLAAGRTEVGVTISMDIGNRRFKYSDALGSALRPYKLPIAPMASFGLEAYPLATSDVPVLRDLGFRGRFSRAFGLDSTTPEGDTIETSWTRFGGDVRQRLLIPGRHPLEFGAFFGADASYFVMSSKSSIMALLPSARTIALRFGLDGRVLVSGRFSTLLSLAYLAVTSPGEIYTHFRDPEVAGVDGELGCAIALIPGLEARLSGRYTRYFSSFKPQPGDPYVAGGALDEQLQIGLGVRYAH
ncbi:MAG TPA: hypothetical protein VJV79_20875 [Polyangiaceae bacterium]|nr:hypothetical protein [Polyangiaceae bacterium]